MDFSDYRDLLESTREFFQEGDYKRAEPILHQILLRNNRIPEVFQMLATIYYDQGKFTKAITTFRRALEIEPTYTDASIGLSIVLNDIGRYDEGRKVFDDAQSILSQSKTQADPFLDEKLATKHTELGDLYNQYSRHDEAIDQYYKALRLSVKKTEVSMKVIESFLKKGDSRNAIREAKNIIRDYPQFIPVRVKLGIILYNNKQVVEAVEAWETVLLRDPENPEAKSYIQIAQRAGATTQLEA